ncbi:hypothetical protein [Streptomyces palmae]|uniref:Uncharacterized protein n=1 Tax=Streptomyces palmae TaxID=1701085 RepID=A0A4Z0GMH8_9ACTN|nr:hypothetical protein [Streptomyces palmae]TGA97335.1 hypothetical protein E4099_23585 [Streptomyces palmae]
MGQGQILTRGTRTFGALVCAVLGLLSLAWIIRDLDEANETSNLWWSWAIGSWSWPSGTWGGGFGSGLVDLALLVLCLFTGVTVVRSPSAAGALGALGAVVVLLRLPLLWTIQADWLDGAPFPDGFRTRATLTGWADVLLGLALLVAVAVGRRPAPPAGQGHTTAPAGYGYPAPLAERPPTVPAPGPGVLASLFFAGTAAAIAGWQIYWAQERDWDVYKDRITGDHVLGTVLAPPPAWAAWAVALLALAAAVAAGRRTDYARPLGMIVATLILADGIAITSFLFKLKVVQHFDELPSEGTLFVLTAFFYVLAGLVALVAMAQRGLRPGEGWPRPGAPGYGAPGGYGYPASPLGYGPTGPGGGNLPPGTPPPPPMPPSTGSGW